MKNRRLLYLCLGLWLCACSSPSMKVEEFNSEDEWMALVPDSTELLNNRINITTKLHDSILDVNGNEGQRKEFMTMVYKYIAFNMIYPETEYKKGIESEVFMAIHYDSCGYIYEIEPMVFQSYKAFFLEAIRIIKTIPQLPVSEAGELSCGFIFDIKRYNDIQKRK